MLKVDDLRGLLAYDPSSGHFTWRVRRGRAAAGKQAGYPQSRGYIQIGVRGSLYLAHRLAWLYMTGEWPVAEIDHRDGVINNNKWENLRPATRPENQQRGAKFSCDKPGF